MLIGTTNDVLMSQAVGKEEERTSTQKLIVTSEESREPDESAYNDARSPEDVSSENGRNSVVSDPGYISCAGSDGSSILGIEAEASSEDCSRYNSTEYNAVISPCNTSISDVLNDTYIASNRNSPVSSDTESDFSNPLDFMPNSPEDSQTRDLFEKGLCERARSLPISTVRLNQAMPSVMNWSAHQHGCTSGSCDQRMDFDMFFDGVLESKYMDISMNANNSSIFTNSGSDRIPQQQQQPQATVSYIQPNTGDLNQNQKCKNLSAMEDFSLSVDDFCFEDEVLGNSSNIQDVQNRTLSPSSDFSTCEMRSPTRQMCVANNNTSAQYPSYDYSSSSRGGCSVRRVQSRVFATKSSEKPESASASAAVDTKQSFATSAEEEAWRSYLENPLTAATTAMMSIHGDEDSAAALGLLYDYYKVPREKRLLNYPSTMGDMSSRSLMPQKTVVQPLASGVNPANVLSNSISLASNTIRPVKNEPRNVAVEGQMFETVSDIIKQHRPSLLDESRVKQEIDLDIPQDLSASYSSKDTKLSSRRYRVPPSNVNNNSPNMLLPSSSPSFTTLSTFATTSLRDTIMHGTPAICPGDSFEYVMEAPKSLKQKDGDPTMSYINKGQFYCITLRNTEDRWSFKSTRVKSVVHIVFGDGKSEEEQQRHWKYWHARQHTVKQRIIDIADYKESNMIYDVDEIAHNAISFSWNVNEVARIFISCNCLSTDFSAQKGIKGLPLLIQIDTYVDGKEVPYHRGQCQIKVFCDKGAERKIRDEERKATKRRQKNSKQGSTSSSNTTNNMITIATPELKQIVTSSPTSSNQTGQPPPKRTDFVIFKTSNDNETRPVLFVPEVPGHSVTSHVIASPTVSPNTTPTLSPHFVGSMEAEPSYQPAVEFPERGVKRALSEDDRGPVSKVSRVSEGEKILLYVRQSTDEVYDGLMLKTPTLEGLKQAIQEKYNCAAESIKQVFKNSKKGILVRMDDNIIRHYSNEDTFVIDIQRDASGDVTTYKVTLTEV